MSEKLTKSLLLRNRMDKCDGMFSLKHPAAHDGLLTVLESLTNTVIVRVDGRQTFRTLSEARRETAVCPHAGINQGVSSSGGLKIRAPQ